MQDPTRRHLPRIVSARSRPPLRIWDWPLWAWWMMALAALATLAYQGYVLPRLSFGMSAELNSFSLTVTLIAACECVGCQCAGAT